MGTSAAEIFDQVVFAVAKLLYVCPETKDQRLVRAALQNDHLDEFIQGVIDNTFSPPDKYVKPPPPPKLDPEDTGKF